MNTPNFDEMKLQFTGLEKVLKAVMENTGTHRAIIDVKTVEEAVWDLTFCERNLKILHDLMVIFKLSDVEEITSTVNALAFDRDALRDELAHKSYAAGQALNEINSLLGEPEWEYPLQVFRSVVKYRDEHNRLVEHHKEHHPE